MSSRLTLYILFGLSLIATFSSLYFSDVLKIPPCSLCWYQRAMLYPIVLLTVTAIIRKDHNVLPYILTLSLIGGAIALYHNFIAYGLIAEGWTPCSFGVSCADQTIEEYQVNNDLKIIGGVVIISIALLTALVVFGSQAESSPSVEPIAVNKGELVRDNSYQTGPKDAPIQLVEFADFQCPACRATEPTLKQLLSEYGDKIHFIYRNFPLSIHNNADTAALAAEAAGAQGKFWEMKALLYENQNEWNVAINPSNIFNRYAKNLGLDEEKFQASIKDQGLIDKIRRDKGDSAALNLSGTPTLFVNGVQYQDVPSYEKLKQLFDSKLGS